MNDIKDESEKMDNYGVWIKNPPQEIEGEDDLATESVEEEKDLSDFSELDNALSEDDDDIFSDIDFPSTAEDILNNDDDSGDFSSEDTALTAEELSNIAVFQEEESPATDDSENFDDEFDLGEINSHDIEGSLPPEALGQTPEDYTGKDFSVENNDFEEPKTESADDSSMDMDTSDLPDMDDSDDFFVEGATAKKDENSDFEVPNTDLPDDFSIDDTDFSSEESFDAPSDETPSIEVPAKSDGGDSGEASVDIDSFGDGDIDLDSFMGDSSGGGSGDVEFSFEDGDIDLGDFMGDGFASGGSSSKAPAEIQDEQTLEIDVSFDESAKEIALEDTPENEALMNPPPPPKEEEKLPSDEMFSSFEAAVANVGIPSGESAASSSSDGGGADESIDLSEFGFDDDDSNIGMTNGPEGSSPLRKEVINYDMKVTVDDDSKTPPVQDVINGKFDSENDSNDSNEDIATAQENIAVEDNMNNAVSPEISEKGKEILDEIMVQLSALKDEIKNLKSDFATLSSTPAPSPSAEAPAETPDFGGMPDFGGSNDLNEDSTPPMPDMPDSSSSDDGGFFGADDGDDSIALSGSELTDILNSAEFSEESADMTEPQVEENPEPEMEENSVGDDDIAEDSIADDDLRMDFNSNDMEEPTIESTEVSPEDLENTTDEFGEANVLPDEISVPKDEDIGVDPSDDLADSSTSEGLNNEALDEYMADDVPISDSLTDDKLDYLGQNPVMEEPSSGQPNVEDIMKENISLQPDDEASVDIVGEDINSAFDEADAAESDIMDNSLEAKDAYENSISGIMQENISMQPDDEASIDIAGEDINSAFDAADAAESDIMDESLAAKDAYEKEINKSVEDEPGDGDFGIDDPSDSDDSFEEPTVEDTIIDEPAVEEPAVDEPAIEDSAEETSFEEPVVEEPMTEDSIEETSVEEPVIEEPAVEEPAPKAEIPAQGAQEPSRSSSIPKSLKEEIVSVLSYMDQLLENLPEDKITEFAKSEHFVTYKKLFDELGLS